jgi:hypothetical protein
LDIRPRQPVSAAGHREAGVGQPAAGSATAWVLKPVCRLAEYLGSPAARAR